MGQASCLGAEHIEQLLHPYLHGIPLQPGIAQNLETYLSLLLKWNARTNLTSIREPAEIVRRHFGESIFAARQIGQCETLLDFGSGAGFPGLPIQLVRPELRVTLTESQNKKATFLREAVRTLNLQAEIWAARVEALPETRHFDIVTMRAVDDMATAVVAAATRASMRIVILSTAKQHLHVPNGFRIERTVQIPESDEGRVFVFRRFDAV